MNCDAYLASTCFIIKIGIHIYVKWKSVPGYHFFGKSGWYGRDPEILLPLIGYLGKGYDFLVFLGNLIYFTFILSIVSVIFSN